MFQKDLNYVDHTRIIDNWLNKLQESLSNSTASHMILQEIGKAWNHEKNYIDYQCNRQKVSLNQATATIFS